jgi:predicted phage tail protein
MLGIGIALFAVATLATAGGGAIFGAAIAKNIGFLAATQALGASLALGGIGQLIAPTPTFSALERGKEAARFESFTFSGITNTAQQGLPVPICYGRAYIGSAVISSGLDVDQLI